MADMTVRFFGVRGSIASPGESTAGFGGNTSCVEVRVGDTRLILDSGTGIRALGGLLLQDPAAQAKGVEATLLLSHLHWDHIQGLPFFAPIYMPHTKLRICGEGSPELGLREALSLQMRPPTFPVLWEDLPAQLSYRTLRHGQRFVIDDVEVRCAKLNHPGGGVLAYRLEHGGRSVVFATDTEHYECIDPTLLKLALGADVLIYDAQYLPEEYRGDVGMAKVGWGHSTYEAATKLARAAGVGRLVLFHHDPSRDDAGVQALEDRARAEFDRTECAREGREIVMPDVAERAA